MSRDAPRRGPAGAAPAFSETQHFDQWWLWMILVVGAVGPFLVLTYVVVEQLGLGRPVGDRPMPDAMAVGVWAGFGALMAAVLIMFRRAALIVEVLPDGVSIEFRSFLRKRLIAYEEIESFAAETYSPLGEFGGWGVRGLGANTAFNVKGDRGVRLRLRDGKRLMIGSQRAEALERAIARCSGRDPG